MLDNDLKRAYAAQDVLTEEQIDKVDAVVNQSCDELTADELRYLLHQLCELNHRGDF